ncbi:SGNH/GDSL hydrolase family protein [Amycolatopsis sp. NBC_01480]|uniref:SGNH/GDSL hydrolase family protein n=1 Tax=Amycolatopsis sp. NBC_01480 TaxID=2903562 RepID=UPI002E2E733D|nr:SGNH/GDSL hydrolase family protein [Amycolatopsis sp. NBC_01480]
MRRIAVLATALTSALVAVLAGTSPTDAATTDASWCTTHDKVAILGTSADTGYGTTGYPADADTYRPTTYGWTTKINLSLASQWGTVTTNHSHNGAMAMDYLTGGRWPDTTAALADITTTKPNLIIIDLGGNEFWSQVTPSTFGANLTTVVNDVKAATPGATILLSIYPQLKWTPNPYAGTENYTWDSYAQQIYNTAVNTQEALIDLRQYVPPAGNPNLPNPSPWTADNIHLNDAGNLIEYGGYWGWASAIASVC